MGKILDEARAFAKARDDLFDRTKAKAGAALAEELDVNFILQNPDQYLRLLFLKVGVKVAREMIPEARKIGERYGRGFEQTDNRNA